MICADPEVRELWVVAELIVQIAGVISMVHARGIRAKARAPAELLMYAVTQQCTAICMVQQQHTLAVQAL